LFADHAGQRHARALDGGHLDSELAQRGRHLGADESEPHRDRAAPPLDDGADAVAILDRAKLEDPAQLGPGDRQRAITSACRHQQPVVGDPVATLQCHDFLSGVERGRSRPQRELDALLAVILRRLDQLTFEVDLAAKITLGQGRTVVGQLGFGADQADVTVEALIAQGRGRRGPGQGGANDHDTGSLHILPYRSLPRPARPRSDRQARPPTACYSRETMTNRSLFYGWWIVAAFSVTTFMSTGVRHAVGPFLKPIVADLGIDRASFSIVIALSLFLYGLFMPIAGMALDRFSVRVVTSAGTILLVFSLVLTAMVRNFWEFAAVYGVLVPIGLAGTGPVIASGVVARWFNKRRGTALSVLGSASMTGMSFLVPAITWLIITRGWRMTYVVIGAIILVIVMPLCLWVFRDSPESIGLMPDGAPAKPGAPTGPVERVTAREALQTLAFWQLACSFFTCGFSMSLLSAHGIPMLTDHGYSPMFAS